MFASGKFLYPAAGDLEDHTCHICHEESLTDYSSEDTTEVPMKIFCGHVFGMACLLRWTLNKVDEENYPDCPVCRTVYYYAGGESEPRTPVEASSPPQEDSSEELEINGTALHTYNPRYGGVYLGAPEPVEDVRQRRRAARRRAPMNTASATNVVQEADVSLHDLQYGRRHRIPYGGEISNSPTDRSLVPDQRADDTVDYGSLSSNGSLSPPPPDMDNHPPFRLPSPALSHGSLSDHPSDLGDEPSIDTSAHHSPQNANINDLEIFEAFEAQSEWVRRAERLWDDFLDHITSDTVLNDHIYNRDRRLEVDLTTRARAAELILSFQNVRAFYEAYSQGDWVVSPNEREWFGARFEDLVRHLDRNIEMSEEDWGDYGSLERDEEFFERFGGLWRRMQVHWRYVRIEMVRERRAMRRVFEMDVDGGVE
ncbi:MAG: hypothetical protein L6R38_001901 [Xanthoria sp. 2 TBL-2021]|nr:MAG: hypothetical protein L6R38_001901 [Xanthoria sp. 2 TBL-2021]